MASAFNLTAQINLQGPANLKPVVAQIKRSLSGITTDINIKFDSKAARGVDNLTDRIGVLNRALLEASRNSQTLNSSLSALGNTINQLGNISRVNSSISKTSQSITSTAQAVKGATSEIQEFGKQSALAVRRFAAFSVATSSIFSLINAVSSGARAFIEFDKQIIRLKQTTGAGSVAIKDLESEITSLSINLGVSSEKLAQVAIVLAQAGLSANQTKQALSALAKTELTPSFEDIMQTTEGAIAAMRQFNIESGDLEKALGSINAVAAAFAVESGDIVAAIQRAGGAFAASSKGVSEGVDALNEFIAVFTSVRATTRESAETIATGLRTIFTRIQRGSTIDFLREFGVELTDLDGKFVGPFEAVRRLSDVLNTLDPRDLRFSQIVEELGGFRQIGKVIPLIQQFATAQEALAVAQKGQGSLTAAQVTAQQALANQLARVREEFLALIRTVGESQTFQVLFKSVLGLTSGLIKLASVLKPILPLLTIIGAIKGGSALTQYAGGFFGGLKKTTATGSNNEQSLLSTNNTAAQDRSVATERANAAIAENTSSLRNLTTSVQNLIQAINNRGASPTGFARGGVVPGSGNRDTVPAMLTPGEFVIRKKAVAAIGASNLANMNKYASGGIVKKAKGGKIVQAALGEPTEAAHVGGDLDLDAQKFRELLSRTKDKKIFASILENSGTSVQSGTDITSAGRAVLNQLSDSDIQQLMQNIGLKTKENILLNIPRSFNQALRTGNPDLVAQSDLSSFIANNPKAVSKLPKVLQTSSQPQNIANALQSLNPPSFNGVPAFDSDYELDSIKDNITGGISTDTLSLMFRGASRDFWAKAGLRPDRARAQDRLNVKKFMAGGSVEEVASARGISIEDAILQQIKELGNISGVKNILGIGGGDRTLDSLLRAGNIRAGKNVPQAVEYVNEALAKVKQSGASQAKAIEAATKVAIVGLQPLDKSEIEGPLDIGGKNVVIYIRGLAKQFAEAVNKMREGISGTIRGFAENIQSQAIFGGDKPLRLDFDETLVGGADIYDKNGQIDIAGYSDLNRVKESLKQGRLTPLGNKVKELLALDPSFADRISVLTARPQSNADLLSQRLNELGLPIPASKITGTSGGGAAKAAALKETERLIDDNLENIRVARSQNKSAVQYQPVRDLSSDEQAATGLANIEGSVLEATLTALGARGGIIQNRAVDYEMGLGPAAQYFPGIGPDWPTEVKRTLDSNSIGRAKEEFGRFFNEKAERFAEGGSAKRYSWKENKGIMDSFNSTRSRYDVFEHSDKGGAEIVYSGSFDDVFKFLQQKRSEQDVKKMAVGGSVQDTVPALLTPGEFVINKKAAQRIGSAKLNRLNKADKLQGFNKGGSVGGVQRFAAGGFVEDQAFAQALRLMAEEMKKGASAMVAAREAAKSIEFALPEAAKFLNEAADNFARTGDVTSFGANTSAKELVSDTLTSSSGDATAAIEALAAQTQNSADVLSLFAEQANQSGVSLQKFQASLKEQLANRALDIQGQRRSTRSDLRKQILRGKVSDLSNEDVVSSLRDNLTSQLTTLSGPSADPNDINAAVDRLITDIGDSSKSFDDIQKSSTLLNQAFDVTRDRADALAAAQEEFSDQLGGLTDAVKVTVDELNALDYQKSGQAAADFGFIGNSRPSQALAFKNSSFGGGLLNTARSFQEGAFLSKLPLIGKGIGGLGQALEGLPGPIGSAVKAIGGLPGALAAVTSMIGSEVIPQLAKALNMGDNETLAGVGGALTQGGSMAVSLGTLGNQLAGPIGGMIGTIGGAVAGTIKGFSDAFRTKALENSLARLTAQTEKVSKAFEYLSKVDNAENVANAQKEVVKLEESMADFKQKSGRSLGERAVDTSVNAAIGATIGGILGATVDVLTGGLTLLGGSATAWGMGIGAGIGAGYGALKAPDELDDEALQALLKTAETFIDGLNKLAERRISLKSIEDIDAVINSYQSANKQIEDDLKAGNIKTRAEAEAKKAEVNMNLGRNSTAVKEAQQGALLNAGMDASDPQAAQIMEREAIIVAEAAAMAELKRQYGEANALIRKRMMGEEALRKRGFELLGIQEYQSNISARLAIVTKQVALETENLIDIYNKMLAGIQAFNSDIANSQIAMEQNVGMLTGNASMGRVDRRNEEVLRNPRGYDQASFDKALSSVAALAGGGQEATKLTSAIRGRKALEENLPRLLRNTTSKDVDKIDTELKTILKDAGVDPETARGLIKEVTQAIEKETEGRQGKSFEELSREFPALQEVIQSAEKAQQVGIALEEAKNNALEQVNKNLDQFSSMMQKAAEWNRKATDIILQGALELDKVLGKGLSLDRLNAPFNAEIESMTAGLNGGVGTMDPVTIAENIRNARKQDEELRNQRNAMSGVEADPNDPDRSALAEVVKAQEELGRASRDSYAALEKLATSGANAANVLSKIDERRQIGKNAANFLEKVFTQTGEEAFNMVKSFNAFQDALTGNLNYGNQEERKLAFEGMNTLLPLLGGSTGGKVQAAMLEKMLQGNGVDLNKELIPAVDGQAAMTYKQVIDLLRNPEQDPVTKNLIDTYNKFVTQQAEAAKALASLTTEAAKDATLKEIEKILNDLRNRLPQVVIDAAKNQANNQAVANPKPAANANQVASAPQTGAGSPTVVQAGQVQVQANQPPEIKMAGAGNPFGAAVNPNANRNPFGGAVNPNANTNPFGGANKPIIQAGQVQVQANQAPEINAPVAPNANNQNIPNAPLIGADNLANINLPALDQVAIAIPKLDNQLLNIINVFGLLNTNMVSLKDAIGSLNKSKEDAGGNGGNNTFGQQVTAFGVSTTSFGTSVTSFGVSIKSFTSYVERLEKVKFPEKITMGGSYTLDVRVSGAAAFEALETKTKQIIDTEISKKLDELQNKIAKATGFAFDPNRRT
jgi:TP901 family phage tail tape measure protein